MCVKSPQSHGSYRGQNKCNWTHNRTVPYVPGLAYVDTDAREDDAPFCVTSQPNESKVILVSYTRDFELRIWLKGLLGKSTSGVTSSKSSQYVRSNTAEGNSDYC